MQIFAISDLHLTSSVNKPMDIFGAKWDNYWQIIKDDWQSKVKNEDLVLIGGDISWAMKLEEVISDLKEIDELNGKKVILRGNHDYWWSSISKVRNILPPSIYAIQNDAIKFEDYIIFGSRGWIIPDATSDKDDITIYKREIERLKLSIVSLDKLYKENDKKIALLHYPPFNVRFNDSEVTSLMEQNKIDKVLYGHLHGNNCRAKDIVVKNGITYYLTSCDLIGNKLIQLY